MVVLKAIYESAVMVMIFEMMLRVVEIAFHPHEHCADKCCRNCVGGDYGIL